MSFATKSLFARATVVGLFVVLAVIATSQAASGARANTPPKYPWHLVDVWWTSRDATPAFSELAIDFEIIGEVPAGVDLYIAPLGLVQIGKIDAYGGIQTSIHGWPNKKDRRLVPIGRGGIFSRWSEDNEPLSLDAATGPAGTHYEAADYENEFVSVRRKIEWKSGRHTYFLRRSRTMTKGLWFTASVKELASGIETEIGSLRFDAADRSLAPSIAGFVEIYGSTSVIPQLTVILSEPRVDGAKRPATEMSITYPDNGADGKVRFANASERQGRVVITLMPAGVRNRPDASSNR